MTDKQLKNNFQDFYIKSDFDDLVIHGVISVAENPVGILQLVHGMAEHKERYRSFMQFMSGYGYICVIHDQRGHGKSIKHKNDLGYMYDGGYRALVEDIHLVTTYVKRRYPDLPMILFGHSMGAFAVRSFAKKYDNEIDGLIISGTPANNPAVGFGVFLADVITIMHNDHHRSPLLQSMSIGPYERRFRNETKLNSWISTDMEVVDRYNEDEMCGFVFTTNGFRNLYKLIADAYSNHGWILQNSHLPVWFISGEDDPCMVNRKQFDKAVSHMKKVGYEQVDFKLYPGMRHEILNETEHQTVWNDILKKMEDWTTIK